ncbi:MAG: NapC/NirT family cytochrome c [Gallionella sp.]|jgi:cytochrome c-type protein NapC|nr:NapC/NirT family cytochrome c [Gallionella sp.]MCK9352651.1 NapC/NirT family cytochrome c [Gallionella sp.]
MVEESQKEKPASPKTGIWQKLRRPTQYSLITLLAAGVLLGVSAWGGLNMAMEWTNRSEFCTSCHEMTIPYKELQQTVHYKNRSGTTVNCSDCHVASSKTPSDYVYKSLQKLFAARDIVGHVSGIVDTPEKFEAHRLEMAKRVWERMKSRDSKECRNCHNFATMDPDKQKARSQIKHEEAQEDNLTCIDCHKGIAHKPVHHLLDEETDTAAN